MKGKLKVVLSLLGFMAVCLFVNVNLQASDTLEDGLLWLTKAEVNGKLGKPTYLYCEEEPYRRYVMVVPENEAALKATFLYDALIHDIYHVKRGNNTLEYRIYYGEDFSDGKKVCRVSKYVITFLDGAVPLSKAAELVPEFKPAYESKKVYKERMMNYDNIRLIFVTDKVSALSKRIGSLFTDIDKDITDWSLSYMVTFCGGEREAISPNSMINKIIVLVDGEYRIGKTAREFNSSLIKNPLQ